MQQQTKMAVRKILKEAANHRTLVEPSDAERLAWMVARAYELGHAARKKHIRRSHAWTKWVRP